MSKKTRSLKSILQLPMSCVIFIYWILIFLKGNPALLDSNLGYIWYAVLLLGIPFFLLLIFFNRIIYFFISFLNSILWTIFAIWFNGFSQNTFIEPYDNQNLLLELFISSNPILFLILGTVSMVTLISVITEKIRYLTTHQGLEWVVFFIGIGMLSGLYPLVQYWNLGFWVCAISSIYLSLYSYQALRSKNLEQAGYLISGVRIINLIFNVIIIGAVTFLGFFNGDSYTFEKKLFLFSIGGFFGSLFCYLMGYLKKPVRKTFISISSIILGLLFTIFLDWLISLEITWLSTIIFGGIFAIVLNSLDVFIPQQGSKKLVLRSYAVEVNTATTIVVILYLSILFGVTLGSYNPHVFQIITINVMIAYLLFFVFLVFFDKESRSVKIIKKYVRELWRYKKQWKHIFIEASLIISLFILVPKILPYTQDSQGFPQTLAVKQGCVITEMPSFSAVGIRSLINAPWFIQEEQIDPIITRSLAKNEYETIQITLNNWGSRPLEIYGVVLRNSSYKGYQSALMGNPVNQVWNGSFWSINRFELRFAVEHPNGYISTLKEMNYSASLKIPPGTAFSLWISIYAAPDLGSGYYSDDFIIQTSAWDCNVTLQSYIWDFQLPLEYSHHLLMRNLDEWFYNSDQFYHYPSSHLVSLFEYRTAIWRGFIENTTGLFKWNYNVSSLNSYYDAFGWENLTAVAKTLRWFAIRESVEDFQYLSLLKNNEPNSNLFDINYTSSNWDKILDLSLDYTEYLRFRTLVGNRLHSIL